MRHFKYLTILAVIAIFALNTAAASAAAVAVCHCPAMSGAQFTADQAMPCHNTGDLSEKAQVEMPSQKAPSCIKCGCGHCNITSFLLPVTPPAAETRDETASHSIYADHFTTSVFYGIDAPPKHLS